MSSENGVLDYSIPVVLSAVAMVAVVLGVVGMSVGVTGGVADGGVATVGKGKGSLQ